MTFKDTEEGQTHSQNDGCGIKEHNMTFEERVIKEFEEKTKCNKHEDCPITCDVGVINAFSKSFLKESLELQKKEIISLGEGIIKEEKRFFTDKGCGLCVEDDYCSHEIKIEAIEDYKAKILGL